MERLSFVYSKMLKEKLYLIKFITSAFRTAAINPNIYSVIEVMILNISPKLIKQN